MHRNPENLPSVLIVEDELVLRMRAVNIVEDAGFNPVEAVDADEALSILEARSDISALFTDIQMPGSIDGLKLAHAVHERWPSIRIILVSGRIAPLEADRPADSRFFGKPVPDATMIAQLQEMLGTESLKVLRPSLPVVAEYAPAHDTLLTENASLKLLVEQAKLDAEAFLAQAGIDAKQRDAAEKLQQLILGELHHRIKNTLATVNAIVSQSLRTAVSLDYGKQSIDSRLLALGRAHDLLMQVSWSNASLASTIKAATQPHDGGDGKFVITGPEVSVSSSGVIALAMTFNELCTNTTKFGALSTAAGSVEIGWVVEEQRVKITWAERGGPTVRAPTRQSFGTRMIGSLGQQLKGDVKLTFEPSGLVYALDIPLSSIA